MLASKCESATYWIIRCFCGTFSTEHYLDSTTGARASGIARTRFIDDAVAKALQDGIEQVVILGAGFDCRAYRIRGIERTRVYEVDHPATLAAKKKHLQQVLSTLPPHVTFVEIDFNQHRLADALATKKFDAPRRTLFIWEGVTNYLTKEAVDSTLRYISGASVGSQLIWLIRKSCG